MFDAGGREAPPSPRPSPEGLGFTRKETVAETQAIGFNAEAAENAERLPG
jgi:hypothetical protein